MILLRITILIFSLYGGKQFFVRKIKVPDELSWITTICSTVLLLYVAGFLGLLLPSTFVIFVISCLYGIYILYKQLRSGERFTTNFSWWHAWFIIYLVLMGNTLIGTQLEHYDNFSHWSLIVKFLFTEGRLPTNADTIISYTSYPMGSSLFIYYSTIIAGFKDNVMLISQFLFIAAALFSLGVFIRDKTRVLIVSTLFFTVVLFNYFNISIRLNNLLVDFLLPTLALSGIAAVYACKKNIKLMSFLFFIITAVLNLVKTSGMFFSIIILFYFIYELTQQMKKEKVKVFLTGLTAIICSFAPILYWNYYVKNNFEITKHEVSLTNYQSLFQAKGATISKDILIKQITYLTDINNTNTQGTLLFVVVLLVGYLIIRIWTGRKSSLLRILVAGFLIILAYYSGIYLMFLFSMPIDEAVRLAGIERYASSIVIFSLGLAFSAIAIEINYSLYEKNISLRNYKSYKSLLTKKIYQYSTILLSFASVLLLLSEINGIKYHNAQFHKTLPGQFQKVTDQKFELNHERILVVTADKENLNSYYTNFFSTYYLYSTNVIPKEDFMMDNQSFRTFIESFDSIVILEEHWKFMELFKQMTGDVPKIGVYAVKDL